MRRRSKVFGSFGACVLYSSDDLFHFGFGSEGEQDVGRKRCKSMEKFRIDGMSQKKVSGHNGASVSVGRTAAGCMSLGWKSLATHRPHCNHFQSLDASRSSLLCVSCFLSFALLSLILNQSPDCFYHTFSLLLVKQANAPSPVRNDWPLDLTNSTRSSRSL